MEKRVGFGPRLGAYLIDMVIVIILGWIFALLFAGAFAALGAGVGGEMGGIVGAVGGIIVGAAFASILYFLLEGLKGYTLGKLLLGLQIANEDGTAGDINLFLKRFALKNISALVTIVAMIPFLAWLGIIGKLAGLAIFIGCFFVLGDKRQAFHDTLIKTAVFRKEDIQ